MASDVLAAPYVLEYTYQRSTGPVIGRFLGGLRAGVILGVKTADLADVNVTTEKLRLQREVVAASRRAFELSEQQLRAGTADIVTVLNTQLTLFQAEDALSQAQLARLLAIVSLYQALGGGWEPRTERPVDAL